MNFVQEDRDQHFNNNEEEADDEELVMMRETNTNFPFSSSSSSASASSKQQQQQYHHQNLWLGNLDSQQDYKTQDSSAINFDNKVELMMDLSLGSSSNSNNNNNNNNEESNMVGVGGSGTSRSIEKEHMFDKVVTPSDVGKLNRLVIPKQHAEKYFPLDSSSNEKGLLLNFEDRNGKSWRFRYSYWNSSQSYVMTKGWSRFVKEKKLDAGDIVSFQRGVGESAKDRLYIDWRRRPNAPDPTSLARIHLQNQFNTFPPSVRWGRLYSLPQPMCLSSRNYEPLHRLNYSIYPYNHHHQHQQQQQQQQLHQLQQHQQQQAFSYGNAAAAAQQYYNRTSTSSGPHHHHHPMQGEPMVIDSVPVNHHDVQINNKNAGKRLRLFGVNMECGSTQDDESSSTTNFPARGANPMPIGSDHDSPQYFSSSSSLQSRFSNHSSTTAPLSGMQQVEYSKKGKSSLSIDLDL